MNHKIYYDRVKNVSGSWFRPHEPHRTARTDYTCNHTLTDGELWFHCDRVIDHEGDHKQWENTGMKQEVIASWDNNRQIPKVRGILIDVLGVPLFKVVEKLFTEEWREGITRVSKQ